MLKITYRNNKCVCMGEHINCINDNVWDGCQERRALSQVLCKLHFALKGKKWRGLMPVLQFNVPSDNKNNQED